MITASVIKELNLHTEFNLQSFSEQLFWKKADTSSLPEIFCKKSVLKNLKNSQENRSTSLFFIKKRGSGTGVFATDQVCLIYVVSDRSSTWC